MRKSRSARAGLASSIVAIKASGVASKRTMEPPMSGLSSDHPGIMIRICASVSPYSQAFFVLPR
jgi:hypothetical protein